MTNHPTVDRWARLALVETFEATLQSVSGASFQFPVSSSVGGGLVIVGQSADDKTAMACQAAQSFLGAFDGGVVTVVADLTAGEHQRDDWSFNGVADDRSRLICHSDTAAAAEAIQAHARPLRRTRHHPRMLVCSEAGMLVDEHADSWKTITGRWWNNGRCCGWGWDHETFLVLTSDRRNNVDLSGLDGGFLNELQLCGHQERAKEQTNASSTADDVR